MSDEKKLPTDEELDRVYEWIQDSGFDVIKWEYACGHSEPTIQWFPDLYKELERQRNA